MFFKRFDFDSELLIFFFKRVGQLFSFVGQLFYLVNVDLKLTNKKWVISNEENKKKQLLNYNNYIVELVFPL